jgi:hypothetical protein
MPDTLYVVEEEGSGPVGVLGELLHATDAAVAIKPKS